MDLIPWRRGGPALPPYDPAKDDEELPWEDEVVAAIEKLRSARRR